MFDELDPTLVYCITHEFSVISEPEPRVGIACLNTEKKVWFVSGGKSVVNVRIMLFVFLRAMMSNYLYVIFFLSLRVFLLDYEVD